tara:strand:+ start:122090 stop:122407 length:318 start_codon:yes stop_codon:yes gene_type:complete
MIRQTDVLGDVSNSPIFAIENKREGHQKMRHAAIALALAGSLGLSACSGLGDRDQKMLSGAAIGAGVGVVGTAVTGGCISCGAVIGGLVGTGAGYILHENDERRK